MPRCGGTARARVWAARFTPSSSDDHVLLTTPTVRGDLEHVHHAARLAVDPALKMRPSGAGGEQLKLQQAVLVGVLGVDRLAGREVKDASQNGHPLRSPADQVH